MSDSDQPQSSSSTTSSSSSSTGTVYKYYALVVDNYVKARNQDILPDLDTEQFLAMKGPAGANLYGVFKTLHLQGRFSRTMIEQAFAFSSTSYQEYIQLWIRSLPPGERSMYAASLYNSNFSGIEWDNQIYQNVQHHLEIEGIYQAIPPAIPLGDDRHRPKMAAVAQYASNFHMLLKHGVLFDGNPRDFFAPLDADYLSMLGGGVDLLVEQGPVFGVNKSVLDWSGARSDTGRVMSDSELILRTWNVLYYAERLSKTELEHALVHGPNGVDRLLKQGARLIGTIFVSSTMITDFLQLVLDMEAIGFAEVPDSNEELLECDYCEEALVKHSACSACKTAMYCSRECQRGDWKRHRPLCQRYKEQNGS